MARDIAQEIINAVKGGASDYIITGLVKEREDKIKAQGLAGSVPTTKDILDVATGLAGVSTSAVNSGVSAPMVGAPQPTATVKQVDSNGIGTIKVDGYIPSEYVVGSAGVSAGGGGIGDIVGGIVLFLVGLALLDRLIK